MPKVDDVVAQMASESRGRYLVLEGEALELVRKVLEHNDSGALPRITMVATRDKLKELYGLEVSKEALTRILRSQLERKSWVK